MKAQFVAMPKDSQEQTCNQAFKQLKQMEAAMGMK
ncbi:DUF5339 family protein [Bisgaardia hudsonensis]|nr:DUF5339 family protein [Bisgaardia hudsonensis]